MEKVSVILICKNEEKKILQCLESVNWADEIIVVDGESIDSTREIAAKFTDKIIINPWEGFANQKMFALQQASNEWVLSIDADERVTPELRDEIIRLENGDIDGYYIKRKNYFLGKLITECGWDKDFQLRLFKKNKTQVTENLVHEGFIVIGKVDYLEQTMLHFSYDSFKSALTKINFYSTLQAKELYKEKKSGIIRIALRSVSQFFIFYISKKGYRDGKYGLLLSYLHFLTIAKTHTKIWKLQKLDKKNKG